MKKGVLVFKPITIGCVWVWLFNDFATIAGAEEGGAGV